MDGPASVEEFNELLSSLMYENANDDIINEVKSAQVICTDVEGQCSNSPVVEINLIPSNDAPIIDLDSNTEGNDYSTSFHGDSVPISSGPSVIDSDSEFLRECTASIVSAPDGESEILTASVPFGCDVTTVNTLNGIVLNGPAPVEEFQHVLASIEYDNLSPVPTVGERKVLVQCTDSEGAVSETSVTLINVATTGAPVVDLSGIHTQGIDWETFADFDDDSTPVGHPTSTVYDQNSLQLSYCEIRLPGPANPGEGFEICELDESITPEWIPSSGVLYLHGLADVQHFAEAINNLDYVRRANVPYDIAEIEIFCVDETGIASEIATSSIHTDHYSHCGASSTTTDDHDSFWVHITDTHNTTDDDDNDFDTFSSYTSLMESQSSFSVRVAVPVANSNSTDDDDDSSTSGFV